MRAVLTVAAAATLLLGCGEVAGPVLELSGPGGRPRDVVGSPRELGATTREALAGPMLRLAVPAGPGARSLELATGVPAGARAAFRLSGPEGEALLFEVVDGGASGRWVPRRIRLPGPGAYRLEVLPAGPWARRFGRSAPPGVVVSVPRLVGEAAGAAAPDRPNVLLISADTLRADRLGCYGAERATSPAIDRLAAEGVRFARAYAPSNWTLPSHYSLFSGLDPSAHGVNPDLIDVGGYQDPSARVSLRGSGRERMLAEAFRDAGYRTRAFTENGWVSARFGFQQGFDAYDSDRDGHLGLTREHGLAWLREHAERGPWFLFLHTYEVHQPYHAPEPHHSRFLDHDHVGFALPGTRVPMQELNRFKTASFPPSRGDIEAFRGLYDAGVSYLDSFVADIRDALEEAGVERRTIVVFTSDHGEELFERGGFDHIGSLHEEVAHVPLVVWAPGHPGVRPGTVVRDWPVSLTDLPATTLSLAGLREEEAVAGQGRDLSVLLSGGAPAGAPSPVFAESRGAASRGVRAVWCPEGDALWKYLRRERGEVHEEWLYELDSDPEERRDRAAEEPERLESMRAVLAERVRAAGRLHEALGAGGEAGLDEETREALRELGYIP